ncbi:fibronectin type III domain-containing protein [Flammeovirgaceae bacterium SG7u.111]|nr:fibronectin type III domain-containing protein [Flammeovirgaceae bacterium SG7u.132]WPO35610.1 fibronectin type III domain-containing protein [Flammeovirgaceae bacterium SG7u.111]
MNSLFIYKKTYFSLLFFLYGSLSIFAQQKYVLEDAANYWEKKISYHASAPSSQSFTLDLAEFKDKLLTDNEVLLPLPNGNFTTFKVQRFESMERDLATAYPSILTFNGHANNNPNLQCRISTTNDRIFAMVTGSQTVYIDPVENNSYISYKSKPLKNDQETLIEPFSQDAIKQTPPSVSKNSRIALAKSTGSQLRTFRIAIAATGEFTSFHGGTKEAAMGAITAALNRVNAIYEKELAVRLVLVNNNDDLIYLDSLSDPYSNWNKISLLSENQSNIDAVIGFGNYDIGHVLCTQTGGASYTSSVCSALKAGGVSGSSSPIGDSYYVDILAHEIGHQFGASHTHNNNCNRNAATAYEPGSGSTIMSYGGTCSPNLQENVDPYFHSASFEQIQTFIDEHALSCAQFIPSGNSPPEISVEPGGFYIPINTPFELTGQGSDPDGNTLTYCWEQFDTGPISELDLPEGSAPSFRSFSPSASPVRVFPKLQAILENSASLGEVLPSYSRTLSFRFTARDNAAIGGVTYDQLTFEATDQAGPFRITAPNSTESLMSGIPQTIKWNVANTKSAPVNCTAINILLSTDGGQTFPDTLAMNTANDGEEVITLPDIPTSEARIKIKASNNIFFDISDQNFPITVPNSPNFILSSVPNEASVCTPSTLTHSLIATSILGFNNPVSLTIKNALPSGIGATFDKSSLSPSDTTSLNFSISELAETGIYPIVVEGSSSGIIQTDTVLLNISNGTPDSIKLIGPSRGLVVSPLYPTFNWQPAKGKLRYELEIAQTASFKNIIHAVSAIESTSFTLQKLLESDQKYYWRVRGVNSCGTGYYSATDSFNTMEIACSSYVGENLPKTIPAEGTPTISSSIFVNEEAILTDINVTNINGIHSYMSDLSFELISPQGTKVKLLTNKCGDNDLFNMGFDDQAITDTIPCPPVDGISLRPQTSLSALVGENTAGEWILNIFDNQELDGGELNSWGLQLCSSPLPFKFSAMPLSSSEVALSWDDILEDELTYIVERASSNQGVFDTVANLGADKGIFIDENLTKNTNYSYRLKIEYADGRFAYSNTISIITLPDVPYAVTKLKAINITQSSAELIWTDASDDEDGFIIERFSESGILLDTDTVPSDVNRFKESELETNTNYTFLVKAYNSIGSSENAPEITILTLPIAPSQPSNLIGEVIDFSSIKLSWTDLSDNEEEFVIERRKEINEDFLKIATVSANQTNYFDTELDAATNYYYRIKAQNQGGGSTYTDTIQVLTLPSPPAEPSFLNGNITNSNTINLWWKDNATNEDGFILERSEGNTENFQLVDSLSANSTNYPDTNRLANVAYIYRVKAYNLGGNSANSNYLSITIFPDSPVPPDKLRVFEIMQTSVGLTWEDNANNESGFIIERSKNTYANYSSIDSTLVNQTVYTDTSLLPNTIYFFKVRAYNENGFSSTSNEIQIETLPLVPSAPSELEIQSFSNNELTLSWIDNSNNEEAFVIERSLGDNQQYQAIATITSGTNKFFDFGVRLGNTYFYRVAASNKGGLSEYSNEVSTLTVGISKQLDEASIFIHPNPHSGRFELNTGNLKLLSLEVFSIDGKVVPHTKLIQLSGQKFVVEMKDVIAGIYFIHIVTNKGSIIKKALKY